MHSYHNPLRDYEENCEWNESCHVVHPCWKYLLNGKQSRAVVVLPPVFVRAERFPIVTDTRRLLRSCRGHHHSWTKCAEILFGVVYCCYVFLNCNYVVSVLWLNIYYLLLIIIISNELYCFQYWIVKKLIGWCVVDVNVNSTLISKHGFSKPDFEFLIRFVCRMVHTYLFNGTFF